MSALTAAWCLQLIRAGKTTLIRTLLALTRADGGKMALLGILSRTSGAGRWRGSARSWTSRAFTRT